MPSAKISALTAATTPLTTDLHVLARSTTNRKITTAALFYETLTFTQFIAKVTNGELIAGRWYEVTECGHDLQQVIAVLATASNNWSPRVIWLSCPNDPVQCDAENLNQEFTRYYDSKGNNYERYHQSSGDLPPIGAGSSWSNNRVDNSSTCTFQNPVGANVNFNYFSGCSINFAGYTINNSQLSGYNDNNRNSNSLLTITNCELTDISLNDQTKDSTITLINCNFKNVGLDFTGDVVTIDLINLTLENCTLTIIDGNLFSYSSAQNCSLIIARDAVVENLHVTGASIGDTSYTIDGDLQSQVLNNWSGTVVAQGSSDGGGAHRAGFSTVRMLLPSSGSGTNIIGTYDTTSETIVLPDYSPVGIFLLANLDETVVYTPNSVLSAAFYLQHQIQLATLTEFSTGMIDIDMRNTQASTGANAILYYHGKTIKVGQLKSPLDFVRLTARLNPSTLDYSWILEYGAHYD